MSYVPGDMVLVRDDWPEARGPVHIRTPHYLRGRKGRVERYLGRHPNPEDLAFARPAAQRALFQVSFPIAELWPDTSGADSVLVEVYEHWLEQP